ncbi:MAG: hypothetical protein K2Q26_07105 [Bdellovibrionales bacterium]|nr:hypothetical protein [Bdellovibrionales bacterium]
MKSFVLMALIATSSNAFAMSNEQFADCVFDQKQITQVLSGLVKNAAEEKYISQDEVVAMMAEIQKPEIQTCDQVNSLLGDVLAKALKAKANKSLKK